MNVGGAPLVLRRFQIDETGVSGANVWIEARQPGIVRFLLTMVGLDPNSSLRVTRGSISFQNSSVFGMNQVSTHRWRTLARSLVATKSRFGRWCFPA